MPPTRVEPDLGLRVSRLARFFHAGALRGLGATSSSNKKPRGGEDATRVLIHAAEEHYGPGILRRRRRSRRIPED